MQTTARPRCVCITVQRIRGAAIVVAVVTLTRPTVYGYVNGRPVTSLAEARDCSERMFSDMRTDDGDRTAPLRDILDIE